MKRSLLTAFLFAGSLVYAGPVTCIPTTDVLTLNAAGGCTIGALPLQQLCGAGRKRHVYRGLSAGRYHSCDRRFKGVAEFRGIRTLNPNVSAGQDIHFTYQVDVTNVGLVALINSVGHGS